MEHALLRDILLWKKRYRNIYVINICGIIYVYRVLSKGEFTSLLALGKNSSDSDNEEVIFSECLLYPKYSEGMFDNDLAGSSDQLFKSMIDATGFSVTDRFLEDVEKSRNSLGTLENQIVILICKAFPHLTLSDIDNLTYDELLRYMAISEAILDVKITIEKPSPTKPGTIDFDQENKVMNHPVPLDRKKRSLRGDVSK